MLNGLVTNNFGLAISTSVPMNAFIGTEIVSGFSCNFSVSARHPWTRPVLGLIKPSRLRLGIELIYGAAI